MDENEKKVADPEQTPPGSSDTAGEPKPKRYKRPTIAQHGNLRMMTELE